MALQTDTNTTPHCNRGMVFSVRSVPRCYKQDKLAVGWLVGWLVSELDSCGVQSLWAVVVRSWWLRLVTVQGPKGRRTSATESHYQATTSEDYNRHSRSSPDPLCPTVICEMYRTLTAQPVFVVRVVTSSINLITNPNLVYSHQLT
jgi:hypothetical protein